MRRHEISRCSGRGGRDVLPFGSRRGGRSGGGRSGRTTAKAEGEEVPMFDKRRREFITLLGGAAAWPLAGRAQQGDRMRRIGMLMFTTSEEPESQARITALGQGLQEAGWSSAGTYGSMCAGAAAIS